MIDCLLACLQVAFHLQVLSLIKSQSTWQTILSNRWVSKVMMSAIRLANLDDLASTDQVHL
eukprot:COSAG06_NODE_5541_length_3416_cov_5.780525_3_plen_61_part_00